MRLGIVSALAASAFFTLLSVAGCGEKQEPSDGDEGGGGSGGSGALSTEEGCERFWAAQCEKLGECAEGLLLVGYQSVADCTARSALGCATYPSLRGVNQDGAALASCAEAVKSAECAELFANKVPLAGCETVLRGDLPAGASCIDDRQCAAGPCGLGFSTCGTCLGDKELGASCFDDGYCGGALACSADGECVKARGSGASCDEAGACEGALTCVKGTCGAPLDVGAACDPELDACDRGRASSCGTETKRCQDDFAHRAARGEPCGFVGGGIVLCSAADYCDGSECAPRVEDGAECDTSSGDPCLPPATCVAGRCSFDAPKCAR